MKKKGISPLIATVLIIGFTVALAAIIMTWGTNFVKKMQETTEETANVQVACATDVVLNIKSVCNTSSTDYKILIENNGEQAIKEWKVRFYESETQAMTSDVSQEILAFGLDTIEASATGLTAVRKVEVIPIIIKGDKKVTCSQNVESYGDTDGEALAKAC